MLRPSSRHASRPASARDHEVTERRTASEESEWQRRRRLAEVFGDSLPETTSDEREPDPGDGPAGGAEDKTDAWLREQVPPHHG